MKFNNRNIYISDKAVIGNNVKIGDETIIYDNVIINDNTTICNSCVIGEPVNEYYSHINTYENAQTIIGNNCLIRSHAIIYAGCNIGDNFSSGHRITIREHTTFGNSCRIGTLCDIQGYVSFGEHCWLHSNIFVAQHARIANFVFIYPHVVFVNDRYPPSENHEGASIQNFAQIGAGSVILSSINIGKYVLVGAASVVKNNVEDYQVVAGNPSKVIKDVRDIKFANCNNYFPWPLNFTRNMPWEKSGFYQWLENNPQYR